jgi:predicted RNA-binding Zn-ribbon protein involved in translation (DUF1610 family)
LIILICPECTSTHIGRSDDKRFKEGSDVFACEKCGNKFTLEMAQYREEYNEYEE